MGRFDPEEGKPYGFAVDTGEEFATKEAANEWMHQNMGKRVRILNAPRQDQINTYISMEVQDALSGCGDGFSGVDRLIRDGDVTEGEVDKAMVYADMSEHWGDWKRNG